MAPTEVLLVTGSPRGGTTPVGDLLADLPRAASLYEPMGATGDRRFTQRFPIPGAAGFDAAALAGFVEDMQRGRLRFKPQTRVAHKPGKRLFHAVFGTRTLHSYRLLRLQPWTRTIIWKDPQAVFCADALGRMGVRSVVTLRPPFAHAASFKRLGWVSRVDDVYTQYRAAFGPIPGLEAWIGKVGDTPVGSALILWRMIYERFATGAIAPGPMCYLLNLDTLSADEMAGYTALFDWLGRPMPARARDKIANRTATTQDHRPAAERVHDFNRSAAAANAYWSKVLDADDIALAEAINGATWEALRALPPTISPATTGSDQG